MTIGLRQQYWFQKPRAFPVKRVPCAEWIIFFFGNYICDRANCDSIEFAYIIPFRWDIPSSHCVRCCCLWFGEVKMLRNEMRYFVISFLLEFLPEGTRYLLRTLTLTTMFVLCVSHAVRPGVRTTAHRKNNKNSIFFLQFVFQNLK